MKQTSIVFQFEDRRTAYDAFDTLEELGYRPHFHEEGMKPKLHIHVDHRDLTSALEIAHAHGGVFIEQQDIARQSSEYQAFQHGYQLSEESISVPAHVVNEDWTEEYANVAGINADYDASSQAGLDDLDDSFDHFSADVRI